MWYMLVFIIGFVTGAAIFKHKARLALGLIKKLHEVRDSNLVANLTEAEQKILNRAKAVGRKF